MAATSAAWISPYGKIAPVTNGSHIGDIIANPDKFGLTKKEIEDSYKKYGEHIGQEGKAREEIILDVLKSGFSRIRLYRNYWSITIDRMTPKIKRSLSVWAEKAREDRSSGPYMKVKILFAGSNKMEQSTVNDLYYAVEDVGDIIWVNSVKDFNFLVESFKNFIRGKEKYR